jgi:diacylglycerol kinase (ATP)
MSSPVEH